ncbi:potassium channel family protein [Rubrolithibacter danxiaensis]|uniref:potassium channel family protein n=1 Tax=Rubrolithibacter danxiaensis TaxID=3390805 RepID=UPI003BF8568E
MQNELTKQRSKLLFNIERLLEGPMITLGFIWLILLIIEFINGSNSYIELISTVIWVIFIIDFILKFILAPQKLLFLKTNWLTAISLLIPALRLFRIFRFVRLLRAFRGTRLIRVVSSINRGMKSLNATMRRRGFGYVMILTLAIIFSGAAGMYAFENYKGGLESYAEALWWTTMLVITIGSDFWPHTTEGRVLCFLLAIYGFAVFGYITATLASFFIGRDAEEKNAPVAGSDDIQKLRKEIRELSRIIEQLNSRK